MGGATLWAPQGSSSLEDPHTVRYTHSLRRVESLIPSWPPEKDKESMSFPCVAPKNCCCCCSDRSWCWGQVKERNRPELATNEGAGSLWERSRRPLYTCLARFDFLIVLARSQVFRPGWGLEHTSSSLRAAFLFVHLSRPLLLAVLLPAASLDAVSIKMSRALWKKSQKCRIDSPKFRGAIFSNIFVT